MNGAVEKKPRQQRRFDERMEAQLVDKLSAFIRQADVREEARRQSDRIGDNLYSGRHWNIPIPARRAAITANVTKALIDHSIAIQTKQDPIPVVEPDDVGDVHSATLMRSVLQRWWDQDDMRLKSRQALRLAKTTRTCGAKVRWDHTLKGGAGDITCDIIPGWRLLLDSRTRFTKKMQYIGDRSLMTRSEALIEYGENEQIIDRILGGGQSAGNVLGGGSSESPIRGQWGGTGATVDSASTSGGTLINGKPVITAQTARPVAAGKPSDEIEICEIYWRDYTLVPKEVPVKDASGQVQRTIAREADGAPKFEQTDEYDEILGEPGYALVYQDVTRIEMRPKYPHWRRSTMVMPDRTLIDDSPWDKPQPYAILNDNEPLVGPWSKGSALDLEDLQAALNVSLSTMMDNLRFSSYRAFKALNTTQIERNNLVLSPGEIIRLAGTNINDLQPLEFPGLSDSWFNWLNNIISLMERVVGASGIMQGNASEAPRADSSAAFDSLAEIGGSRLVEATQRFELWIADIIEIVGWFAQRYYTEAHAIKVEDAEGQLTWERASGPLLFGTFSYTIQTGSTMAWNQSGIRRRLLEDMDKGLRDKVSLWKHPAMAIEDWPAIKKRMESQSPMLNPPPPKRTRQSTAKNGARAHQGHTGA